MSLPQNSGKGCGRVPQVRPLHPQKKKPFLVAGKKESQGNSTDMEGKKKGLQDDSSRRPGVPLNGKGGGSTLERLGGQGGGASEELRFWEASFLTPESEFSLLPHGQGGKKEDPPFRGGGGEALKKVSCFG